MKLLGLLVDKAPNRVFISIVLGVLAGAAYALVIPIVLSGLAPEDGAFATAYPETGFFLSWQVSRYNFAIVFVVACAIVLVARTASQVILTRVAMDVATDLRTDLYRRIANAPIAQLERVGLPKLIASITSDVPALVGGARLLPDLLTNVVTLVGMLAYVFYLNAAVFRFVLWSIVIGALTYQLPMLLGRRYLIRSRKHLDGLHESIRGLVYGAKELKLNQDKREDYFHNVLKQHEYAVRDTSKTGNTIIRVAQNYGDILSFFVIGVVSFIFINYHSIPATDLTGIIMVLLYVTGPVAVMLNFVPQLVGARIALKRVNELFGRIEDETVELHSEPRRGWKTARFAGVAYRYDDRGGEHGFAVGPVDFEIRKGQVTFIVGGNGSGKSTLSKVITLHYRPTEGEIAFDGERVDAHNLNGFRRGIAAIYSDYYLFERVLGIEGRDVQADVDGYLKMLDLDRKVTFKDGRFSTLALSDGQRRRLALVAAYLEDADLYLFDEWAADQDPTFKQVFYNRILPDLKAKGKAVVVISHDDRYFAVADQRIVMSEGRIVEIVTAPGAAIEAASPVEVPSIEAPRVDAPPPASLPALVVERARNEPNRVACRFFSGPDLVPRTLSFLELWQQSEALAATLRAHGLTGERALIVCKAQQPFVVAFYACLLAGVVAVPTAVPRRRNLVDRLQLIVGDAQARAVIADTDVLDAGLSDALIRIDLRVPVPPATAAPGDLPVVDPDAPAFLQYTSGSTGDPKGVVVTHGNLVRNCAAIAEAMALSPASSLLTALPLFHDMGLVGGVLQFMFTGCVAGFLPPAECVQYPERWLRIVTRYGINVSGGPNFIYDLAARTIDDGDLGDVDLSAWRVAFCGAEPVRAATVARFAERFGRVGFRAGAFYPCYGMAESTLFITGTRVGTPARVLRRDGADVVGCGYPRGDTRVVIVDPDTHAPVADGETGEIWVSGGSVAQGYWRRPDLSRQVFHATLAGGDGTSHLRTGDLGFVSDGELFVSGRLKDLIVVNGRKYAPQDIEDECERAHEAVREGAGAAFGVAAGETERLVVAFELKRDWLRRGDDWPQVRGAVRQRVGDAFGLPVSDVVLLRPGTLPRTSSGKVRRSQCRLDYLAGALECADDGVAA